LRSRVMGTSYDPTTYLNQQATIAPFTSRVASAAGRLRSSRPLSSKLVGHCWCVIGTNPAGELITYGLPVVREEYRNDSVI